MILEVAGPPIRIETDRYYLTSDGWRYHESGNLVTWKGAIKALDKWHAEAWKRANPTLDDPKPKRKWEIAFDNGGYQTVEAHSFILSDSDIAFHVDGQLPAVFWAPTRNIYHMKEIS